MLVYKTIEMVAQVLNNNNRVKFPNDILMYCSVYQHGRRDVMWKPSILSGLFCIYFYDSSAHYVTLVN